MMDQAFEKINKYEPAGADGFTLGLLSLLLTNVDREYQQLRVGYLKNRALEAWACRNLLELDIFTKWVLQSPDNVRRFTADVALDGIELFKSMKEWWLFWEQGADTKEMDETLRLAYERKSREGTTETKHLEVRVLADCVGMTEDYRHTNKLCSKFIHTMAWSIIHRDEEEGEFGAFRVILFQAGSRYGIDAYCTIREYLQKS